MAKKLSMTTCLLCVAVVLALVYFFRPQTFSFLKQGFADEDYEDEKEGFDPIEEFGDDDEKKEGFNSIDEFGDDDEKNN